MRPSFPIYIVSKGRADTRHTARALDAIGVPFLMVVEHAEYPEYADTVGPGRLLVLDPTFQDQYDTFDDVGTTKSKGPGAARNFAWAHAAAAGHAWHWVMDDNIRRFVRMNHNTKYQVTDGTIFRCMEDFALRYSTVAMAGPAYEFFVPKKQKHPPFVMNTRIYSCNLIRNDVPFRWRGRYNEDTDLSLRMLKAGWCTVQFNAFQQKKIETQSVAGGCNRDFYQVEGTTPKSAMLQRMHPDVTRIVTRFGRVHHHVDYRPFRQNKLVLSDVAAITDGINDYGMTIVKA